MSKPKSSKKSDLTLPPTADAYGKAPKAPKPRKPRKPRAKPPETERSPLSDGAAPALSTPEVKAEMPLHQDPRVIARRIRQNGGY